jgi:hypothetical protein
VSASEGDSRGGALGAAAAAALGVLLLYAGAYLALVERHFVAVSMARSIPRAGCFADYRAGGRFARAFFTPAHAIDRRIRPAFWDDEWSALPIRLREDAR